MPNDVAGQFHGGPLDGGVPPDHRRAGWYVEDGHAYAFRDGRWTYVGAECPGCSATNQPGDDARIPGACRLCGASLAAAVQ